MIDCEDPHSDECATAQGQIDALPFICDDSDDMCKFEAQANLRSTNGGQAWRDSLVTRAVQMASMTTATDLDAQLKRAKSNTPFMGFQIPRALGNLYPGATRHAHRYAQQLIEAIRKTIKSSGMGEECPAQFNAAFDARFKTYIRTYKLSPATAEMSALSACVGKLAAAKKDKAAMAQGYLTTLEATMNTDSLVATEMQTQTLNG